MPRKESTLVSVILAAGEDMEMLDRAINSVLQQTFADWELWVIGQGSADGIHEDMRPWTRQDRRIRAVELMGSRGHREVGLGVARGKFMTHLDACDEYYPDYLEHVAEHCDEADVLVFGYDLVYRDGTTSEHLARRSPPAGRNVFAAQPAAPLAIAHCRTIVERIGGFHELLWHQEDSDLWRRLALADAQLRFMSLKSGRQHVSMIKTK